MDETKGRAYPMEYTEEELRRLRFQGRYWGDISLQVLREAGVGTGMRVLDLGPRLWRVFRDAGLDEPRLVVRQKLHPAPCREGVRWVSELVRSLVPEMERLGVVSAEEVGIETLEERLHQALLSREATLCTPLVVGACSRVRIS